MRETVLKIFGSSRGNGAKGMKKTTTLKESRSSSFLRRITLSNDLEKEGATKRSSSTNHCHGMCFDNFGYGNSMSAPESRNALSTTTTTTSSSSQSSASSCAQICMARGHCDCVSNSSSSASSSPSRRAATDVTNEFYAD